MSSRTKDAPARSKGRGRANKDRDEDSSDDGEEEEEGDVDWYSTGYDEADRIPDSDNIRLRIDPRETRMILFIDGDGDEDKERFDVKIGAPVCVWEYEVPIYGSDGKPKWGTTITCLKGRKVKKTGKPAVDYVRRLAADLTPYYAGFYTVADITDSWDHFLDGGGSDDDGGGGRRRRRRKRREPKDPQIKLLMAKKKSLKEHRDVAAKEGGLRGCVFEVHRSKKWASRTGDKWEFDRRLTEDEIREIMPEKMDLPLDYKTLLAPSSKEEVEAILDIRVSKADLEERDKKSGRNDDRDRDRDRDRGRGRGRDRDDYDDYDRDRDRGSSRRSRDDRDDRDDDRDRGRSRGRDDRDDRDRDNRDNRDDRDRDSRDSRDDSEERDTRRGRGRGQDRDDRDRDRDRDDDRDNDRGRSGRRSRSRNDGDGDDVGPEDNIDF